jgi:hypothetical protein
MNALALDWDVVVQSRGQSDHAEYVADFADSVRAELDDFDAAGCRGTPAQDDLSAMSHKAAVLVVDALTNSGGADGYTDVVREGNRVMRAMHYTEMVFVPISCTTDNSPRCRNF